KIDRIFMQLADGVTHVEKWQESRRVPGRSASELRALEEHDVGPALLRQVIQGTDADDTAADHDHPSMRSHFYSRRVQARCSVATASHGKAPIATSAYSKASAPTHLFASAEAMWAINVAEGQVWC